MLEPNQQFIKDIINTLGWVSRLQPELVDEFVTYWSIRKSPHATAVNKIEEIKNKNANDWLHLIESNHKFRNVYGEDKALELINVIEEKSFFVN
jgi:hypothetical protein